MFATVKFVIGFLRLMRVALFYYEPSDRSKSEVLLQKASYKDLSAVAASDVVYMQRKAIDGCKLSDDVEWFFFLAVKEFERRVGDAS